MKNVHGGDIYSYKQEMLDFSANISPLGIQPEIMEAAKNALSDMDHYPDVFSRSLRNKIAGKENVPADNIICGNGAAEIVYNLVTALRPKKALFLAPTFAEYEQACEIFVVDKEYFYLKEDKDFELDESICECITEDIDIMFLCNPNNPTGKLIKKELLLEILERCVQNNVFLVVDECFLEVTDKEKELTMVPYTKKYLNLCILKAFTKMYAMPGLRLGYGICSDKELLGKMYMSRQPWSVSVVAEAAGIAALELKWLPKKTVKFVAEERNFMISELEKRGIKVFAGEANYLLLKSRENLVDALLEKSIMVRNCGNYRGLGTEFIRIAVRKHDENQRLLDGIDSIREHNRERR